MVVDSCWAGWMPLEGRFGGQLLSAIAKDRNDNIFPVTMAVVEQENKNSWI